MQVSVEKISTLERRMVVTMPAATLETTVRDRLANLGKSVRLKGFRPGRVPPKVVEQRYGRQVRSEALGELIRSSFNQAIQQEKLRPAAAPNIEADEIDGDNVRFTATFEVVPEIGKIDVSALKVVKPMAEVGDSDVDEMIETLRAQRRSFDPVERAAATGDMVMFESHVEMGEERLPAEGTERSGTILGSGAVLPVVEKELTGKSAGDELDFDLDFPVDWRVSALAGRRGRMHVRVVRVSEPSLPAVDAEFVRAFGIADGELETFRREVRANLQRELKTALSNRLKMQVVDKLVEHHGDIEFPKRMLEAERQALRQQALARAEKQKIPADRVPPESDFAETARKRVAAAVLLGELGRQAELKLDEGRLTEVLSSIASTYEEPEQVLELYRADPQLMTGLQNRVIEDQVIDWIADHADLSEAQLTFAEVMQPGGQA